MDEFDKLVEGLGDIPLSAQKGHVMEWLHQLIEMTELGVKTSLKIIPLVGEDERLLAEALARSQSLNRDLAHMIIGVLEEEDIDFSPYDMDLLIEMAKND